jgi:hypothetical protein
MNKLVLNLVNQNVVGLSYQVPQVVVVFSEGKTLVNSDYYSKTTNQHKRAHVRDLHPATCTSNTRRNRSGLWHRDKRGEVMMRIVYSPVNQAWFLMWNDSVLSVGTKEELELFCVARGITLGE